MVILMRTFRNRSADKNKSEESVRKLSTFRVRMIRRDILLVTHGRAAGDTIEVVVPLHLPAVVRTEK